MADNHSEYIPVRKLNQDGFFTLRFIRPDGTVHEGELPLIQAVAQRTYAIHALWDRKYGIVSDNYDYKSSKVQANLMSLSQTNPLLFEEVLTFLETCPELHSQPMISYLNNRYAYPVDDMPQDAYHPLYRALMDLAPMMHELEDGRKNPLYGDRRFVEARHLVHCGHPHFKAALLAVWILKDTGRIDPLKYVDRADEIEYIDSRFDEVFSARRVLANAGSIRPEHIANVLGAPAALRDGVL